MAAALLVVIFAFGGTELVTIAAAETDDPETNVARAIRTILVRVLVFYVGAVTVLNIMLDVIGSTILAVRTFALISQIILRKRADRARKTMFLKMWLFP